MEDFKDTKKLASNLGIQHHPLFEAQVRLKNGKRSTITVTTTQSSQEKRAKHAKELRKKAGLDTKKVKFSQGALYQSSAVAHIENTLVPGKLYSMPSALFMPTPLQATLPAAVHSVGIRRSSG